MKEPIKFDFSRLGEAGDMDMPSPGSFLAFLAGRGELEPWLQKQIGLYGGSMLEITKGMESRQIDYLYDLRLIDNKVLKLKAEAVKFMDILEGREG